MFKSGDIGFIMHHDNAISKAISWFMQSKWSHSFLVIEVTDKRTYLLETSDFEVTIGYLERYLDDPHTSLEIYRFAVLTEMEVKDHVQDTINSRYGTLYGYLQLISFGLRRLLMRLGIRIKNFFRQGIVCLGIPLTFLSKTKLPPFSGMDPESIDTEEFYQLIRTNENAELIYRKI